jgi:hypothetical protein
VDQKFDPQLKTSPGRTGRSSVAGATREDREISRDEKQLPPIPNDVDIETTTTTEYRNSISSLAIAESYRTAFQRDVMDGFVDQKFDPKLKTKSRVKRRTSISTLPSENLPSTHIHNHMAGLVDQKFDPLAKAKNVYILDRVSDDPDYFFSISTESDTAVEDHPSPSFDNGIEAANAIMHGFAEAYDFKGSTESINSIRVP